jgi:hypothetical protein
MHILVAALIVFWSAGSAAQAGGPRAAPREYAVYGAVLRSMGDQFRTRHLVAETTRGELRDGPRGGDRIRESLERHTALPAELKLEFTARNRVPARLETSGFTGTAVEILPDSAFHRMRVENLRSHRYPEPYPAHGSVRFSRVAFTRDRARALVYVDYHCGGRCGTGELILLRRAGERWEIAERKRLWIS